MRSFRYAYDSLLYSVSSPEKVLFLLEVIMPFWLFPYVCEEPVLLVLLLEYGQYILYSGMVVSFPSCYLNLTHCCILFQVQRRSSFFSKRLCLSGFSHMSVKNWSSRYFSLSMANIFFILGWSLASHRAI